MVNKENLATASHMFKMIRNLVGCMRNKTEKKKKKPMGDHFLNGKSSENTKHAKVTLI